MEQVLLEQLKSKVKKMPYNGLSRIYPDAFNQWFDISNERIGEFISDLMKEQLIVCKYDFDCSCSNRCTAYDYRIRDRVFECQECGKNYSEEHIRRIGELVFELDKKEILEYQQEDINYKNIAKMVGDNIISFNMDKREETKVSEKIVNNINIYGSVKDSQIMQGTENSQQQSSRSNIDYDQILQQLQDLQKYTKEDMFSNEFGPEAEYVKELLNEAIEATEKKEETSKIKSILGEIKDIAGNIMQSVFTIGIKTLVEKMIGGM